MTNYYAAFTLLKRPNLTKSIAIITIVDGGLVVSAQQTLVSAFLFVTG